MAKPRSAAAMSAYLERVEELLSRATEFTFDVDLSGIDASGTRVQLDAIARTHALTVVRNHAGAWGIRWGARPYYWDTRRAEWVTGFHGLGSRDTCLFVLKRIMPAHQKMARDLARRLVEDARHEAAHNA